MLTITRRWSALVALVLALGLAACGDRTNEEIGNSGDREGQAPNLPEGTNPAIQEDESETSDAEQDQGEDQEAR
ncbi:MAG: hypothetical protein M3P39_07205 [Actinomycetota bacterium]|nr:hypothetical protein [Actinomycetota bacterium]